MLSTRIDGTVLVIEVRLSVNLNALTIEQVPPWLCHRGATGRVHRLVHVSGRGKARQLEALYSGAQLEVLQTQRSVHHV